MQLTKENVYVDLRGKSKEELNELWEFLKESNQETYNSGIESFIYDFYNTDTHNYGIEFDNNQWIGSFNDEIKIEITIEQLKELLKPMEKEFDLSMCRVIFDNAEQSKKLQELAFNQGFKWSSNGGTVSHTNARVLYFNSENYKITYSSLDGDDSRFKTFHFIDVFNLESSLEKELLNNKSMVDLMGYSVLVDNEEQARKLQEIAFEQGFKLISGREKLDISLGKHFQFGYGGTKTITYSCNGNHYQDNFITKKAHFNDLFKDETLQEKEQRLLNGNNFGRTVYEQRKEEIMLKAGGVETEPTLEQQLEKAEAEVKRLKEAIRDSKPKTGDWCKFWDDDKSIFIVGKLECVTETSTYPYSVCDDERFKNCEKITDLVILENLNKLQINITL